MTAMRGEQLSLFSAPGIKLCPGCGIVKPVAEFGPRKQSPDGLRPRCKPCRSLYDRAAYHADIDTNRSKEAERARKWREENRDRSNAIAARWREKHRKIKPIPTAEEIAQKEADRLRRKHEARKRTYRKNKEKVLATAARYRAAHKEEERISRAAHYQRNKEHVARWAAAYRKAKPEVSAQSYARRRALLLNATPSWADEKKIQKIYARAARLTRATGIPHEVDHVVPLRGKGVCGLHWEGNLEVVTRAVNRSKLHFRWPDMWQR